MVATSNLRKAIYACYRENSNISGEEIRIKLGKEKNDKQFWRSLEWVQVSMRGQYRSQRKNRDRGVESRMNFRGDKRPTRMIDIPHLEGQVP